MGKTANLELNTTEMSDKISDFVGEYNSNMNMLDDLYGDVQENASSALSTAQSAETKATAAQTAATNAVTTANSANTTAQSAVSTANSANTTAGQANTKADNAVATANTAKDTADEAKETAETASADVADKADVDGTYDSFTAGGAKQLLSTVYVDDNEPYNFRTAGGSADIGDRMYEEVVGGSIVWNQARKFYTASRCTATLNGDVVTITPTETTARYIMGANENTPTYTPVIKDHVYLETVCIKTDGVNAAGFQNYLYLIISTKSLSSSWAWLSTIAKATDSGNCGVQLYSYNQAEYQIKKDTFMLFDLTQMFGSTIADYIYSLEQGTAGAGVAWFRKLFPKPYYAYNAGELMSVKAGSHDTVGFNALGVSDYLKRANYNKDVGAKLDTVGGTPTISGENPVVVDIDGTWNGVTLVSEPLAQGCPYQFTVTWTASTIANTRFSTYMIDDDYIVIERMGNYSGADNIVSTFTPSRGGLRFALTVVSTTVQKITLNDPCLHLVWDGERNGEYEPYEKHEYPLAELELRGIPKLDANNQLYYDGDTYASDGTVTRKYGIVDLGTLSWTYNSSNNRFQSAASGAVGWAANVIANAICSHYQTVTFDSLYIGGDGVLAFDATNLRIRDTRYTDAATFKTAMSGVYLVYELAEPTTETADTFVNPQVVDDFGTEEYVDYAYEAGDRDVAIPVGHNSQYMNNLRAKLEMVPESPSGDGKYIVQQSNGENAYVPYTADGRLDAIEAKLPAPPSANGTYKLTATVSNNGVTYSWQS